MSARSVCKHGGAVIYSFPCTIPFSSAWNVLLKSHRKGKLNRKIPSHRRENGEFKKIMLPHALSQ